MFICIHIRFLIAGSDYVSLVYIQVGFMSGDPLGSTACLNVSIIDDDIIEAVETFTVNASSSDPVRISPTAQAEISIADNDGKSIKEEMLYIEKRMLINYCQFHQYSCRDSLESAGL